jgi:hypothetical protein
MIAERAMGTRVDTVSLLHFAHQKDSKKRS